MTTYSDSIEEIDVHKIDLKPKTTEPQPISVAYSSPQSIIPEWQRQAIMNSLNVSPQQYMQQQCISIANQYQQQMTQCQLSNTQNALNNTGEELGILLLILNSLKNK